MYTMPAGLLDKLLKDRPKTASEVVAKVVAALESLETPQKEQQVEKALESITKYLAHAKVFLFGDEEHEVSKDSVIQLAMDACQTDMLYLLVKHLGELDFETRKDAAQVFGATVRIRDNDDRCPGAAYVKTRPYIMDKLFQGCVPHARVPGPVVQ